VLPNLRHESDHKLSAITLKPVGRPIPGRLPLPYIRPIGSKCFAGGLLHFAVRVSKQGTYGNRRLHRCQPHPPRGVASPKRHSMFKTPERKEFPSRRSGALADNRPTPFDAKSGEMFRQKYLKTRGNHCRRLTILRPFGRIPSSEPPAERWQSG